MPSYKQCLRAGRAIGWKPRDELQKIHLEFICENPFNLTKGTRQWGKTFNHSFHGYSGLTLSESLGIGMPTQAQGSRILANSVSKMMKRLESLKATQIRREQDNALYKEWSGDVNAVMGVLSMHETGDPEKQGKSTEGWTFRTVKFDEGHLCGTDIYNKVLPTTDSFSMFGIPINIGILGVGGYANTLIEIMLDDEKAGYKCMRVIPDLDNKYVPKGKKFVVTDREIIYNLLEYWPYDENGEPCPKRGDIRRKFYTERHASIPANVWSQFYLCETQHGGHGLIFADLPTSVPMFWNMNPRKTISIDVGAGEDPTIVSVWWNDGTHRDLFECHRLVEHDVSKTVAWAVGIMERHFDRLDPANVRYEKNGPGKQFGIALQEYWPWKMAAGVHTSDQGAKGKQGKKTRWLQRAQRECAGGTFAVSDKWAHDQLARLSYEVDDDGNYKWPHDDVLSTVWIDFSNAGSATGV